MGIARRWLILGVVERFSYGFHISSEGWGGLVTRVAARFQLGTSSPHIPEHTAPARRGFCGFSVFLRVKFATANGYGPCTVRSGVECTFLREVWILALCETWLRGPAYKGLREVSH